jgi:hypothetical protein
MSPTAVGTATGAAALTVGRGVLSAAAGGLSFFAELAKAASGVAAEETKSASVASSRALADLIARLQERIKQHLSTEGIRLNKPVELITNGAGGIAVAGPHPEQAAIEAALASDYLIERDFQQVAEQSAADASAFTLTITPDD